MPEQEIGRRQGRGGGALAKVFQVVRKQDEGTEDARGEQHREERREDAPYPTLVKGEDGEPTGIGFVQDDRGDQIAGDDEKHIDTNEAAGKGGKAGVEEQDRDYCDRPKPVDVRAMPEGSPRVAD